MVPDLYKVITCLMKLSYHPSMPSKGSEQSHASIFACLFNKSLSSHRMPLDE